MLWWQSGIIYEIYLRSFQDSNGDGIGDIRGVIQRLDYLEWLGITAIWLTPFYPSPMKDFGYDISDYRGVHPMFGAGQDFDDLLHEVHRRNMKLIIDFVPNHSSDQHVWFAESRSSRDNPKRNWYIWKDAKPDGSEPNNWLGVLGGSAWQWDEHTGQYYYHAFLREQPDLNLRNPEVQEAMMDVMRFWLDKGVDGFRVDVLWHLAKDQKYRDNPVNPDYKSDMPTCDQLVQVYSCDQPDVHKIVHRFRELLDGYNDKVMIGELYLPVDKVVGYYGADNRGAHLPGNFQLLLLPWKAKQLAIAIDQYESALPEQAWPNWSIGNHDRPRLITRVNEAQAKVAALLLLTLRGTPALYYGDEIGMRNVPIPPEEAQDPQGLLMPDKNLGRDPQRTPMQWDGSENAGFTTAKPWLRLDEAFAQNNVALQKEDSSSLLCFYKHLIALRQREPALTKGDYYPVPAEGEVLAYIRREKGQPSFLVVLNLSGEPAAFRPGDKNLRGKVILSTVSEWKDQNLKEGKSLKANEGVLAKLEENAAY